MEVSDKMVDRIFDMLIPVYGDSANTTAHVMICSRFIKTLTEEDLKKYASLPVKKFVELAYSKMK